MLDPVPSRETIAAIENAPGPFFSNITKGVLLLLKSLFATRIIAFFLGQKRFRVHYGLAPDRRPPTMLAVPYRAKDLPALRAQFSYPDVVTMLTCLSYYYRGLSEDERQTCLEKLSELDQVDQEYVRRACGIANLPASQKHFPGVNFKDSTLFLDTTYPAFALLQACH